MPDSCELISDSTYRTPVAEVKLKPAREDEVWVLTTWAARVPGEDVVTSTTP